MATPLLSKTSFMHSLDCPILVWLEKVRKDLLPPFDVATEHIMAQGQEVDDLARQLYPGGVNCDGFNWAGFRNTKTAILSGAITLYQPTFIADGLTIRADIMTKNNDGSWDIHEVKGATKVKDEYRYDLAFQKVCVEAAGFTVARTMLIHVDNTYVRNGAIDVQSLLVEEDVTDEVNDRIAEVRAGIPIAKDILTWPKLLLPIHLDRCPDITTCPYVAHWFDSLDPESLESILDHLTVSQRAVMIENRVFDISRLHGAYLSAIPYVSDEERWPLSIDINGIREELSGLEYPLYFFDYETYAAAVPPFDGYRPYQQIPFQFSVYVIEKPGVPGIRHDFLADTYVDPAPNMLRSLRSAIGDSGTVISWYASFEKGRNTEMAAAHPEYAPFLESVNARTYDLMRVFKKRGARLYVHPGFRGSASLKAVMPTLVPELSYKTLAIQEGGTASVSWPKLCDTSMDPSERARLRDDMIAYCRLDVYGMVRILEEVQRAVGNKDT